MNRDRIRWTISRAEEITTLAPQALLFGALAKANPQHPRYPSQSMDGGSRSTDATSSVERAAMHPDPVQARLASMASDIDLAVEALKRVADAAHWLAHPTQAKERPNDVQVCIACNTPCLPRAISHAGQGPLDEACYQSWRRFKMGRPHDSFQQWLAKRVDTVDAA
jgi:hypothetical protein